MASTSMTLADMRTFVYDTLDTDSTDLPTDLLDRFFIDGNQRVEATSDSWEFRQVDYTFTTTAGTQAYNVRDAAALVSGVEQPLRSISDARGPLWSIRPEDHRVMRARTRATATFTGQPTTMTLWGSSLYLWPTPNDAYAISLTAIREPIDWVGTSGTPDLPDDLAELVLWWGLSRAYARDGDLVSAQFHRDEFFVELPKRAAQYMGTLTAQPLILGGGTGLKNDFALSHWLAPLVFDWENA